MNRAHLEGASYLRKPVTENDLAVFVRRSVRSQLRAVLQRWRSEYALTRAELLVLQDAVDGTSRKHSARKRAITAATFKNHVHNLVQKTGDTSLKDACIRLLQQEKDRDVDPRVHARPLATGYRRYGRKS